VPRIKSSQQQQPRATRPPTLDARRAVYFLVVVAQASLDAQRNVYFLVVVAQASLDAQRNVYRPIAATGSRLFFTLLGNHE